MYLCNMDLVNQNTSVSGKINFSEIVEIFKGYNFKSKNYVPIVKKYSLFLHEHNLAINEVSKNVYLNYLRKKRNIKNIYTYQTPINKLLRIAEVNKFLNFYVNLDRKKQRKIDTKLEAYFEAFLEWSVSLKNEATKNTYRSSFKQFLKFIEHRNLEFNYLSLREFQKKLHHEIGVGQIKATTANLYLTVLQKFAEYLLEERESIFKERAEEIAHDLQRMLRLRKFKNYNSNVAKKASLTDLEVRRVLAEAKNARDKLLIALMYYACLRSSEAIKVKLSDFDFENKTLKVIGKGNKEAIVPLGYCFHTLKKHLDKYLAEYQIEDKLFEIQDTATVRSFVNEILQKLKLKIKKGKKVSTHSFRHSMIQGLVKSRLSLVLVQKIARHSNIATTQQYFVWLQEQNELEVPENIF